ncbi:MAG: hypothetical protein M3169_02690 [Candidatus Eremiobacteraeota bacterium]|nr:hypothetical protein [Candidatus Eremiobacteraeota bacterium]
MGAIDDHLKEVDRRLTARTDNLERRMERGFTRVDERFDALTAEMRSGFDELRRSDRRRRPKRDD